MSAGVLAALFALATIVVCVTVMFMVACGASTRALTVGAGGAVVLAALAVTLRLIATF